MARRRLFKEGPVDPTVDPLDFLGSFWFEGRSGAAVPEDIDMEQLEQGIDVEMEHTSDPRIARKIALDHLAEFPNYYTELAEMEERLRRGETSGRTCSPIVSRGTKKWHWVEDDDSLVVFVGTSAEARRFYMRHGGEKRGLHLMSGFVAAGLRPPIVGQIWG